MIVLPSVHFNALYTFTFWPYFGTTSLKQSGPEPATNAATSASPSISWSGERTNQATQLFTINTNLSVGGQFIDIRTLLAKIPLDQYVFKQDITHVLLTWCSLTLTTEHVLYVRIEALSTQPLSNLRYRHNLHWFHVSVGHDQQQQQQQQ